MNRVLQVVADGRAGGGSSHVLQLCRSMADGGLDVHLLTERDSHVESQAATVGLNVSGLPFFRAGRLDPRLWLDVGRLMRLLAPSVIHAHGARGALPIAASRMWPGSGRSPFVYTVHGYHFLAKRKAARRLAASAERFCSRSADRTVFVCEHDRAIARRWHFLQSSRAGDVIYNGIDLSDLPSHRPPERFAMAFLGRLTPQKNPLMLADIMERLRDLPVDLRIIGDGDLRDELEGRVAAKGLADRVLITGELSRTEALRELSRCHALILPSRWEGLPIAVLEAMAMGVVAVTSAVGGLTEMIEPGKSGWLISPEDIDGFAHAVRTLALDRDLAAGMAENAKRLVLDRFAWDRTLEAHLSLYQRLMV